MHHQEKKLINAHHLVDSSQQEHLNFAHCGLSPGTSPVSASAAEGSHQQTISSLAKAGYRGKMYAANSATSQRSQNLQTKNEDIEKDSINNSDATRDLNIISRNELHRSKKLSWQHEDFQVRSISFKLFKDVLHNNFPFNLITEKRNKRFCRFKRLY